MAIGDDNKISKEEITNIENRTILGKNTSFSQGFFSKSHFYFSQDGTNIQGGLRYNLSQNKMEVSDDGVNWTLLVQSGTDLSIQIVAGENIPKLSPVYLGIDGKVYLNGINFIGYSSEIISSQDTGSVKVFGELTGFFGLTPNTIINNSFVKDSSTILVNFNIGIQNKIEQSKNQAIAKNNYNIDKSNPGSFDNTNEEFLDRFTFVNGINNSVNINNSDCQYLDDSYQAKATITETRINNSTSSGNVNFSGSSDFKYQEKIIKSFNINAIKEGFYLDFRIGTESYYPLSIFRVFYADGEIEDLIMDKFGAQRTKYNFKVKHKHINKVEILYQAPKGDSHGVNWNFYDFGSINFTYTSPNKLNILLKTIKKLNTNSLFLYNDFLKNGGTIDLKLKNFTGSYGNYYQYDTDKSASDTIVSGLSSPVTFDYLYFLKYSNYTYKIVITNSSNVVKFISSAVPSGTIFDVVKIDISSISLSNGDKIITENSSYSQNIGNTYSESSKSTVMTFNKNFFSSGLYLSNEKILLEKITDLGISKTDINSFENIDISSIPNNQNISLEYTINPSSDNTKSPGLKGFSVVNRET